jgi:hypothetical protein
VATNGDVGLALVSIAASGAPAPGFSSRTASGADAAPFAAVGIGFAATRTVRVRADMLAVFLAHPAEIQGDHQPLARWGAPILAPSLGLDLGWF